MAYSKTTWADGTTPAISATNLNKIENELYNLSVTEWSNNNIAWTGHQELPSGSGLKFCWGNITVTSTGSSYYFDEAFDNQCLAVAVSCEGHVFMAANSVEHDYFYAQLSGSGTSYSCDYIAIGY